jgi:hypothetical protein
MELRQIPERGIAVSAHGLDNRCRGGVDIGGVLALVREELRERRLEA